MAKNAAAPKKTAKKRPDPVFEAHAAKYGYHQLFALRTAADIQDMAKAFADRLKPGDKVEFWTIMGLTQNRMAYDRAAGEYLKK